MFLVFIGNHHIDHQLTRSCVSDQQVSDPTLVGFNIVKRQFNFYYFVKKTANMESGCSWLQIKIDTSCFHLAKLFCWYILAGSKSVFHLVPVFPGNICPNNGCNSG